MTDQIPQSQPPLTPQQERQWAMIAHLSVLINLFTVFMGTFVPLVIYFLHKDRSRYVAYHSMQSFVMQAVCSFGGTLFAVVIGGFSQLLPGIGLICLPVSCLFAVLPVVALIYGAYGGIQINQGNTFKYWMVGDWVGNALGYRES
ncbi:MAG: DUF4870 domain-containing protein [Anaerolineales bacterium]|jgi:uncharacterized Tic20 family protein|nr:DUF4870 domain-containing protein [Chloroflexota bacterium]MBK6645848.1 DUF4870 domain-containing protein [Anaerolineales bacterium]